MPAYVAETLLAIDALVSGKTLRIERQRKHIAVMAISGTDTIGMERRLMIMQADLCLIGRIRAHILLDID